MGLLEFAMLTLTVTTVVTGIGAWEARGNLNRTIRSHYILRNAIEAGQTKRWSFGLPKLSLTIDDRDILTVEDYDAEFHRKYRAKCFAYSMLVVMNALVFCMSAGAVLAYITHS